MGVGMCVVCVAGIRSLESRVWCRHAEGWYARHDVHESIVRRYRGCYMPDSGLGVLFKCETGICGVLAGRDGCLIFS